MTTLSTSAAQPAPADYPPAPPPAPPSAGAVWRAMFFKESRELAVPAALAMLVYGGILAVELYQYSRIAINRGAGTAGDVLLGGTTAMAAALAAVLMGFVQFFTESRVDRFGFLTHRPVSRGRIFWCKAAVGMGLYGLALGLPLLVALWWASNPYNMPEPFTWRMGLAPLADILSGIPYYFAGILAAQRMDSRWQGARLLPLAAPVLASLGEYAAPTFSWAVLWIVLAVVPTVIAARGYFVAAGQYHPMCRWPRAALGIIVLTALLLLGGTGLSILEELCRPTSTYTVSGRGASFIEYDQNGTPYIVGSRDGRQITTDLAGAPATIELGSLRQPSRLGGSWEFHRTRLHASDTYFFPTFSDNRVRWYIAQPPAQGSYFVGYAPRERRLEGAIGANGFEADVAVPRARFAGPLDVVNRPNALHYRELITVGGALYRLIDDRKLELAFTAPEPILRLGSFSTRDWTETTQPVYDWYPMLSTAHEVVLFSSDELPQPVVRYALPDAERWEIAAMHIRTADLFLMELTPRRYPPYDNREAGRAVYFKADGTFDHQVALPELPIMWGTVEANVVDDYIAPALFPPAGLHAVLLAQHLLNPETSRTSDPQMYREKMRCVILNACVAVLCAVGMFLLARRQFRPRAVGFWTVVTLLLGPAGILLLLCTSGLSVIARCAACGKWRPVTADLCPHCGVAVAPPARKGTEIFV